MTSTNKFTEQLLTESTPLKEEVKILCSRRSCNTKYMQYKRTIHTYAFIYKIFFDNYCDISESKL